MLVRCVYASRAASPEDLSALDSILRQSRSNNGPRGITGMLCFAEGVFVQAIEGGRSEVSRLIGAILRDPRHHDMEIVSFEEISERQFGGWTMGQINAADVNGALILKYSQTAKFDPFSCGAAATMAILREIAASGNVVCRTK